MTDSNAPEYWQSLLRQVQGNRDALAVRVQELEKSIRRWIMEIMSRRQQSICWFEEKWTGNQLMFPCLCRNWDKCYSRCVLREMMNAAGIVPQVDGALDKQAITPAAEKKDCLDIIHARPHDSNDVAAKRTAVAKQRQELFGQPTEWVTCPCGNRLALKMAFRCWECGIIFCRECAETHFGVKPKTACIEDPAAEKKE